MTTNDLPPQPAKTHRSHPGRVLIILSLLSIVAVLLAVGYGVFSGAPFLHLGSAVSTTPSNTATLPATLPPTAIPTATPKGPHILTGATLGGTQAAFMAAFGAPRNIGFLQYTFMLPDGTYGYVGGTTMPGADGQARLVRLGFQPVGGSWTAQQTFDAENLFLPPDAIYRQSIISRGAHWAIFESLDLQDSTSPPQLFLSLDCQLINTAGCEMLAAEVVPA
jgi:hypothetical protein